MRRAGLLLPAVVLACAHALAPPGGEVDREAPRLIGTMPEQQAIVPGFDDKVVFSFDEKIGERGARDAVLVSPETGPPVLERDGSDLKVWLRGGWQPNQIYRVIITPGVQDRFGNARREPAELVFSTGPELTETAIAGLITDRLTGRPLAEMRVQAISVPDTATVHSTVTDTAGFFGLRFLPAGSYRILAFEDANRNKRADRTERRDQLERTLRTATDTQVVELALLSPDSTPARLLRADPVDSVQVRLSFDDHLDPTQPLDRIGVALFQMPDSARVGMPMRLLTTRELARLRLPPADTSGRRPVPAAAGQAVSDTSRVLPFQELVLLTEMPLLPSTRYRIEVSGATNITGLPGGGGSVSFTTRARAEPPPRRDTTQIAPRASAGRRR